MRNFLSLKKVYQYILLHWPYFGITLIWLVLFATNFTPGTTLSGWDNLQTELNPGLAVKRAFFSSWQEYQSLGLAAGMGHAADLVRAVLLYLASFIIPQDMVRFTFHISMFLVAGFGMLKLLGETGFKDGKKAFAFVGALLYIFNYYALQMMALPYESFSVFFAMLPWELWAFLKILTNKPVAKYDWLIFSAVFILATPQSQALQVFVVLGILLSVLSLGQIIRLKSLSVAKNAVIGGVLVLAINSYWILPQLHFLNTESSVVTSSKTNQLSSEDIFYRNKDKGDINNFVTNTGFFNDGKTSEQELIFLPWIEHRENLPIATILYLFTGLSFFGILVPSKYRLAFLFSYIIMFIALLNNTIIFEQINSLLRQNSFINQIFRSPFTKFSIPAALISAYFAACAIAFISDTISRKIRSNKASYVSYFLVGLASLLILYQALPAFRGVLFARTMKVAIPGAYFEAIDYFKSVDKNKRIGLLPEYTFWGWYNHTWGYDGSGFIWYGIEQPIISRTFDVWSSQSENYFWEVKRALEAENVEEFEKVAEKYGVDYFLFDRSIAPLGATAKALAYTKIEEMLAKSETINIEKQWDFLTLYKIANDKNTKDFIYGVNNVPNIGPEILATNFDTAYQNNGDYITDKEAAFDSYYPFLDLTTQVNLQDSEWTLSEHSSYWTLTRPVPNLNEANMEPREEEYDFILYQYENAVGYPFRYSVRFDDELVEVRFPKILLNSFSGKDADVKDCIDDEGVIDTAISGNALTIKSHDGNYSCFSFFDGNLSQRYGYVIKVNNENIEGQRLFFYIQDKTKDQSYTEDRLRNDTAYYVLGERFTEGLGYTFAFQNTSYKNLPSENTFENIEIFAMPYDVIKNLAVTQNNITSAIYPNTITAKKESYYLYTASLKKGSVELIVLNQSYQPGWHAYRVKGFDYFTKNFTFIFGKEIKNHVKVNNWANGWKLSGNDIMGEDEEIVIVYLPQYLEYAGFGIVSLASIFILARLFLKKIKK